MEEIIWLLGYSLTLCRGGARWHGDKDLTWSPDSYLLRVLTTTSEQDEVCGHFNPVTKIWISATTVLPFITPNVTCKSTSCKELIHC